MKLFLLLAFFLCTACGKLHEFQKSVEKLSPFDKSFNGLSPTASSALTSDSFTPGAYFAVVTNSGPSKDTLVYEFQYLAGNKFLIRKTVFLEGKPEKGLYHKKTGTFSETMGIIKHTVDYDSCGDLSLLDLKITGDKNAAIKLTYNSVTYPLYSQSGYAFSSTIAQAMTAIVEDVGCKLIPAL